MAWRYPILLLIPALVLALAASGCVYPEPLDDDDNGDDDTGDDDTGDDDTGDDDTGDDDTGDDDTGDDDTGDDGDGDGWTVADGDCDDGDPTVYPGAQDVCDDKDNDCNGLVNDQTTGWDAYEIDDDTPWDLGEISEDETELFSFSQGPGDVDRFMFWVEDDNDIAGDGFFVYAQVDWQPGGVDLSLSLNRLTDHLGNDWWMDLDHADEGGAGAPEDVEHEGTWGANDDGFYEIVVTAVGGYDCEGAYHLYIETGS